MNVVILPVFFKGFYFEFQQPLDQWQEPKDSKPVTVEEVHSTLLFVRDFAATGSFSFNPRAHRTVPIHSTFLCWQQALTFNLSYFFRNIMGQSNTHHVEIFGLSAVTSKFSGIFYRRYWQEKYILLCFWSWEIPFDMQTHPFLLYLL